MVAAPSSRCSWSRVARGPEAEAQHGPGLATSGVQVERGHPPHPPDAGEGGEEAEHLRLVLVDVLHVVGAHAEVHGGGTAAPSAVAILELATLKRSRGLQTAEVPAAGLVWLVYCMVCCMEYW